MLLIDLSQIALANFMVQLQFNNEELDLNTFRFMILQTIKKNIKKHKADFGNTVVLACDAPNSWRKDYFTYYKANRIKDRDADNAIDWKTIFEYLDIVKAELKEYFPYRLIQIPRCEGDDVIATLAMNHFEKTVIISGDKDFQQLQRFMHIHQWNPIHDKWVSCPDPNEYLLEHIIKGDKSDGVPNILSSDDQLVMGTRAETLSKKRMTTLKNSIEDGSIINNINWHRNKKVIDLTELPENYKEQILSEFESQAGKSRGKILNYLVKNRLSKLVDSLGDF